MANINFHQLPVRIKR